MPSAEIVKAFEAGGESFCEAVGLKVGDAVGTETAELDAVGVTVGDTCGIEADGLDTVGLIVEST
ncbi:MAG TPA: hypothetical protein DCP31_13590 [Cyanobacteria bacterium UBA8543]|nr:hypothetical protein [Cyanobacteria bacterium UBA8543]